MVQANIQVHKALANTYDAEQPHYRPENKVAVSSRLARLASMAGIQTLIDFGCGTGFIIHLAVIMHQTATAAQEIEAYQISFAIVAAFVQISTN